jgi:hypothetical protein
VTGRSSESTPALRDRVRLGSERFGGTVIRVRGGSRQPVLRGRAVWQMPRTSEPCGGQQRALAMVVDGEEFYGGRYLKRNQWSNSRLPR